MEIGPSSSFQSLRKALLAVQTNAAKSAVVLHIDPAQTNSQNTSILAAYIKPLKQAVASGDPIRAILQTSIIEHSSSHSGVVEMEQKEFDETGLLTLIQAVLTTNEMGSSASSRSLASSGGDIHSCDT